MPLCAGVKGDGTRCTVVVQGAQEFCYHHSPRNAEKRRAVARKGGKSRTPRMVRDLHDLLEDVTQRVIDEELKPYLGMAVSQLVNTRIALLRFEKDLAEQQEVIERLERLEEVASQTQPERSHKWGA
jgi:hypothetical protein